jgi:ribosome-binding protein aMBF1 (putative translation factor)
MSTREAGSDLRGESKKQRTDGSELAVCSDSGAALTYLREGLFDVSVC